MAWTNIGLIFVAGINVGLAILVWLINPRNKINITFAAGVFFIAAWVASTALFRLAPAEELVRFIFQFKLSLGLLVVLMFEIFTLFFPYQKSRVNLINQAIIIVPIVISLFIIIFLPQYTVNKVLLNPGDNLVFVNKIFWVLYSFSFSLAMGLAFFRLFIRLKEQSGFSRIQVGFITISTLIPAVFIWFFNIIFLFFDYFVNDWLGAFLTITLSLVLFYFIFLGGKKLYIR